MATCERIRSLYSLVIFCFLQRVLRPLPGSTRSDTGSQLQVAGESFLDFANVRSRLSSASGVSAISIKTRISNEFLIKSQSAPAIERQRHNNQSRRRFDNRPLIGKQILAER